MVVKLIPPLATVQSGQKTFIEDLPLHAGRTQISSAVFLLKIVISKKIVCRTNGMHNLSREVIYV